jgi:radical SAM superfamily enzyme YgiQ (UPF0313 family)
VKQERNIQVAYKDNGERIASLLAGRGCPYRCVFCASHAVWSRRLRYRSTENVLDEFEQVVADWKVDFIKFSDDTFGLNKVWVARFCDEKLGRGISTPWGCNVRVNGVDEKTLSVMRQAGCREVWAGVESGSTRILDDMKKGIELAEIEWFFAKTRELGFFRRAYVLLGMPNETYDDIKLTEELIDRIKPDSVGFTILAPYPGTDTYNAAVYADTDWSVVDEYENRLVRTAHLSNEDIRREQQRLAQKYKEKLVFRQRPGLK